MKMKVMKITKIEGLKPGDIFFSEGLTANGEIIQTVCKLMAVDMLTSWLTPEISGIFKSFH